MQIHVNINISFIILLLKSKVSKFNKLVIRCILKTKLQIETVNDRHQSQVSLALKLKEILEVIDRPIQVTRIWEVDKELSPSQIRKYRHRHLDYLKVAVAVYNPLHSELQARLNNKCSRKN